MKIKSISVSRDGFDGAFTIAFLVGDATAKVLVYDELEWAQDDIVRWCVEGVHPVTGEKWESKDGRVALRP